MKSLSYDQLILMPLEFQQFYIKFQAKLRVNETELKYMQKKYPEYFTNNDKSHKI
jgi:hypothetical protein